MLHSYIHTLDESNAFASRIDLVIYFSILYDGIMCNIYHAFIAHKANENGALWLFTLLLFFFGPDSFIYQIELS
jgi:hypothetical protein